MRSLISALQKESCTLDTLENSRHGRSKILTSLLAVLALSACGEPMDKSTHSQLIPTAEATTTQTTIDAIVDSPVGPYSQAVRQFEKPNITAPTNRVMTGQPINTISDRTVSVHALVYGRNASHCSGSEVYINGVVGGWLTAKHCVPDGLSVALFDGNDYDSGNRTIVPPSSILRDPNGDIVYLAALNYTPNQVKQQVINNLGLASLMYAPTNSVFVGAGYPMLDGANKSVRTLELSYGGKMNWSINPPNQTLLAMFGNWSVDNSSCSPRSSGGGLWWIDKEGNPIVLGVLSDRREFTPSIGGLWNMPYTKNYGEEIRDGVFELRLGTEIDTDFMCGYTTP